jgi:hypothetical protein|tara:strand:+ start:3907 stop:6408 length:2502 start_codon:yes stop_codon:yes gene_type:complete
MAIDRQLGTENNPDVIDQTKSVDVSVEEFNIDAPEATFDETMLDAMEINIGEDVISFDEPMEEVQEEMPFDANLVDYIDESILGSMSSQLINAVENDKESRKEWEKTYTDGLKYLGMKFDEQRSQPFEGSSGVIHPILAEAVTQFQAQAYKELLPAQGPVKTQIIGQRDMNTEMQAERVCEFMNYYIMNEMPEYDPELDQLLFYLPLSGSAFKKVYYDAAKNRPVSKFVPAEDLLVPYEATDLLGAERVTHVVSMSGNEVRKLQINGFYADVDLKDSETIVRDNISKEIDKIQGVEPDYTGDEQRRLYEIHTVAEIEGFEDLNDEGEPTGLKIPYIITIDDSSQKILAIRRNYEPEDPMRNKINYFVQYKFLPGLGFYGLGLSHMIGGLSKASTSILRQLIDAGTLSNLPAGFKARGIRIRDEASPLQPGEFRDVDAPGGALKDSLMPLPYKEPSGVLFNLLGLLVESGKRFASIADMNIGDSNAAMPVGTTVALLEKGTKVMSAIHKRLHYAQKSEFKILAKVFQEFLPPVYPYETGSGAKEIKIEDFDKKVDVIPVSDPNIFSMSQRVIMAQELLTMVQSNPELHGPQGIYEAYRRMYAALGVDNIETLLTPPADNTPKPMDVGTENSGLLQGMPAQAFPEQNHEAHVDAHKSLFLTQAVQMNPQLQSVIIAHAMQHLQFIATQQAEQQLPPEIQQQIQESIQQAQQLDPQAQQDMQLQIQSVLETYSSPILAKLSNEFLSSVQPPQQQDPLVAIRQQELGLRDKEIDMKNEQFVAKEQQDAMERGTELQLQQQKADQQALVGNEKNDIAKQRLQQQAELKLMDLQARMNK